MPIREAEAFVLRAVPLGESDRIVTFLTRTAGKVRAVAKGARRSRRRFGSNLEPLSRVRLTWFEREGADLGRIESADLLESFYGLQEDPERAAVLACFSEVADTFAREQQEDEAFFRLLHAVLRAVRNGLDLEVAGRYFEIWTLRLHGVFPAADACSRCGREPGAAGALFARRESAFVCGRCAGSRAGGDVRLPAAALGAIAAMLRHAPEALPPLPAAAVRPIATLAAAIFADLTDRRFRSYEVLQALRRPR